MTFGKIESSIRFQTDGDGLIGGGNTGGWFIRHVSIVIRRQFPPAFFCRSYLPMFCEFFLIKRFRPVHGVGLNFPPARKFQSDFPDG